MEYRPAIDGLRAIAVAAVYLFHLDKRLLPGGFVGVDVFFVISGYLITSILLTECETQQFRFAKFYQRRISRIYPASFLVAAIVLLAASLWYLQQDFALIGSDVAASSMLVANINFMLQGNYSQIVPDSRPLLHFWSLSIEEQFYFVYPFFIAWAVRLKLSRRAIAELLMVLTAFSFATCIIVTRSEPKYAFYLLPTRAWELLAGCILAAMTTQDSKSTYSRSQSCLSIAGLAMIFTSFILTRDGKNFPGMIAAIPVIGTVLLIGRRGGSHSIAEQLLSHPILVNIGKASYSLYLWHWPCFCIIDYVLFESSSLTRLLLKISLSLVLSVASHFCFEKPLRRQFNQPEKQTLCLALFVIGTIAAFTTGSIVRNENYVNASMGTIRSGGVAFNSSTSFPRVVLMGDSNASMYGVIMKQIASELPIRVNVISVVAGDPFPESTIFQETLLFLEKERPAITVFAAAWTNQLNGRDKSRIDRALKRILQCTEHVILITQPPILPGDATKSQIRESGSRPVFEDKTIFHDRTAMNQYLMNLSSEKVHVLDINSLFIKPNGEIETKSDAGLQLYHDPTHLSGYGTERVKGYLEAEISRLLSSGSRTLLK